MSRRWWEQCGLDLEEAKKRAASESDGEEAIIEGGGNDPGNNDGPGMRSGVQSINLKYLRAGV